MKIKLKKEKMKKAIDICLPAIAKISTNPITEGFLISASSESIKMTAYSFTNAIVYNFKNFDVNEPGETVIPARLFSAIINKCVAGDISLEATHTGCKIKSGSGEYQLSVHNAEDYPEIPQMTENENPFSISTEVFKRGYKKVIGFTKSDENNGYTKILSSVIKLHATPDIVEFVGCDGVHLSCAKFPNKSKEIIDINISREIARCLSNLECENITIIPGRRHNKITAGDAVYIARVYDGNFVDYKAALNAKFTKTGKIDCVALADAVNMTTPVLEKVEKNPVRLEFSNDEIKVSSTSALGKMKTSIAVEKPIDGLVIGFNAKLLLDALTACSDRIVELHAINGVNAIKLTDDESEIMVMPMRMRDSK